ncbi:MAG: hypothetical protein PHT96_13615 [Syntrophorhabdaceae bacterium]|nr:hypothetical protein [Syntrophorhabdaceae bacterium]MDD4197422.1 hypothetical protein [Syntrophorhabdaceae bacterium]HOC46345.1 hypothetical protein [Syntrophorhabdaceae bacterium]
MKMSRKRALMSAAASILPVPFTNTATDIMVLRDIIPKIAQKFGLAKEQIDGYDRQLSIIIYEVAREVGSKIIGRYLTKDLIIHLLQNMGIKRLTVKQVSRYMPLIGQVVSAGVSYGGMMLVIRHHINECHKVARMVTDRTNHQEKRLQGKR